MTTPTNTELVRALTRAKVEIQLQTIARVMGLPMQERKEDDE